MSGMILISEIHWFLVRHHRCLCSLLSLEESRKVSDVQLRRLLALVDEQIYQHFHARYFGWQACLLSEDSWVSFDVHCGKELRGTIDAVSEQTRGWCLIRPLLWDNSLSLPGLFYHGAKDSEAICVRRLLKGSTLATLQLTFDALHTQHKTLEMVQDAGGTYIA